MTTAIDHRLIQFERGVSAGRDLVRRSPTFAGLTINVRRRIYLHAVIVRLSDGRSAEPAVHCFTDFEGDFIEGATTCGDIKDFMADSWLLSVKQIHILRQVFPASEIERLKLNDLFFDDWLYTEGFEAARAIELASALALPGVVFDLHKCAEQAHWTANVFIHGVWEEARRHAAAMDDVVVVLLPQIVPVEGGPVYRPSLSIRTPMLRHGREEVLYRYGPLANGASYKRPAESHTSFRTQRPSVDQEGGGRRKRRKWSSIPDPFGARRRRAVLSRLSKLSRTEKLE